MNAFVDLDNQGLTLFLQTLGNIVLVLIFLKTFFAISYFIAERERESNSSEIL
jgi:hypothetical protein